ncbi:MAG: guanylate kinase [Candidatus Omnitrophica bacterium]|nr:guanylate kinase [Candidatus Omnitrophota bacterium]MBU2043883.1 guanylate kinase [Candidatus Omnitrophota bacterium]MBU2251054.1 guanylate kinase [Candidatus Omnitrophota bacterium]MBU2473232.1 guanylate kinase [Candidatus Omnitrophota bacterium]
MKRKNPTIFVISGPGGAGKTTLLEQLFKKRQMRDIFIRGVAVTTRKKRPQENNAKDYFFVNKKDFLRLKKEGFFLESQKILNDYYGTPKIFYALAKTQNKDLILCVDVKGGLYLKKKHKAGKIITVFIAAPTQRELYLRMKKRAENKKVMNQRVALAKKELRCAKQYDYLVTNENVARALKRLEEILLSGRR